MNDSAFLVHEVVMRDPVTLQTYRVEIEHATMYASELRLTFFDGSMEKFKILRIGIRDGDLEVKGGDK